MGTDMIGPLELSAQLHGTLKAADIIYQPLLLHRCTVQLYFMRLHDGRSFFARSQKCRRPGVIVDNTSTACFRRCGASRTQSLETYVVLSLPGH